MNIEKQPYIYQPKEEAEENILKFKKEGLEENINALKSRKERETKENVKQSLKIQIVKKEKELEDLRKQLDEMDGGHA